MQDAQVRSLVGEQRSHMLQGDVKMAFLSLSLSLSLSLYIYIYIRNPSRKSLVRVVCGSMAGEHPL